MQKPVWPAGSGVLVVFVVFLVFLVVLFSLLPFGGAFAGEETDDDRLTILITASRFAETVDETLAPVTVITRKEIEQKQAATVEEVLRAVPGVTLSNNGGTGQLTTLFLRGTNSNHVLVLIDGVKVGSAANGLTQFEHLPLDQIEKIEVVRGPRSSLYGSEAIGGVIQIFTRKSQGEPRPRFSVSTGTHDTYRGKVGVSGGGENAWYSLGASTISTDGYDACRAGFCIAERDEDGYDNDSFSLRGGASLTDSFSIEGNFLSSDNDTKFDGFYNESEHIVRAGSVKATLQGSKQWGSSLLISRSKDDFESFGASAMNRFTTTRDQVSWQNNIRVSENSRVIAGVEYSDDKVSRRPNDYVEDSRDNIGVFALLRTAMNTNDLELSLRNDDDEQFGDETTGSIGWGENLGNGKRITVSYGTAFKAPTFNDLYEQESISCFGIFGSNPDLEPETSKSIDVGFSHSSDMGEWAINIYQTEIKNLIASRRTGTRADVNIVCNDDDNDDTTEVNDLADNMPVNIEEARITGIELSGSIRIKDWDVAGTLTWQDAQEIEGDNKDKPLLKRPRKKLDLDFSRRFGGYLFGANIFAQGQSEDFGNFSSVDLAGFALVNLRGEFHIERNWSLGLKFNNLFDKEYETADGYPQDGINFLATLRYIP